MKTVRKKDRVTGPITTQEDRECLVSWEKKIRTEGLGFIQCNNHDLFKINTDFSELKNKNQVVLREQNRRILLLMVILQRPMGGKVNCCSAWVHFVYVKMETSSVFQSCISAYPGPVCLLVLETSEPWKRESSTWYRLFLPAAGSVFGSDRVCVSTLRFL